MQLREHLGRSGRLDPLRRASESALLVAAADLGLDVPSLLRRRTAERRRLFSFDARPKRMTTLDETADGGRRMHCDGRPARAARTLHDGPDGRRHRPAARHRCPRRGPGGRRGLRRRRTPVLGFATRNADDVAPDGTADRDRVESGLCFLGLIAMRDPLRPEVLAAVADCHRAGIRIVVITGDDGLTARAIARQAGIAGEGATVITGPELDALDDRELDALLRTSPQLIVARSSPEAKLRVVDGLRAQGHTVAMTGDGVNDAPAPRRADIGVAMGASGTDVAREAAAMILTDDDFASIVAAVKEGRTVYDNIRKFVVYISAHAAPEMVPFVLYALSGGAISLPLTALLILAIDLGTETLPALALGREPAEPGLMDEAPRPRSSGILTRSMLIRAWVWLGLLEAALVTGGFFFVLLRSGWSPGDAVDAGAPLHHDYLRAVTMTFAGITACQVGAAFAARTTRASLRSIGVFSNPMLVWGVLFELAFAAAIIYAPPLQHLFGTAALGPAELGLLACFPFAVWGGDELRRRHARHAVDAASGSTGTEARTG